MVKIAQTSRNPQKAQFIQINAGVAVKSL